MRIFFLSTSMGMGGADSQLLSAAAVLQANGHDVIIVSLTSLGPMGELARSRGIRTESLEMPRGIPDPRGVLRLIRLIRAWRPDIVHSHMVHANLMARLLRLITPVPALVSTIHSINEGGAARMMGYRLTNGLVDHMTVVSEAAAERVIRERIVPKALLTVIPNGVDMERFSSAPEEMRSALRASLQLGNAFAWLAVGRFEVAKDHPTMLHAFARVHQRRPEAVLLLIGRGRLQAEAETLARSLGFTDAVRFLGVRDDVPEMMSAADGYVMSSAWEGMPMVLLEAAAAGLPIVATKVGGNREVVCEGESGFLVPERSPDALAEAMLRLMQLSDEERRAMGGRGREHVRSHYSVYRVAEDWERIYRDVLARKRGAELVGARS